VKPVAQTVGGLAASVDSDRLLRLLEERAQKHRGPEGVWRAESARARTVVIFAATISPWPGGEAASIAAARDRHDVVVGIRAQHGKSHQNVSCDTRRPKPFSSRSAVSKPPCVEEFGVRGPNRVAGEDVAHAERHELIAVLLSIGCRTGTGSAPSILQRSAHEIVTIRRAWGVVSFPTCLSLRDTRWGVWRRGCVANARCRPRAVSHRVGDVVTR